MSFVEIGNAHVNAFSIDAIEMKDDDGASWWFVVRAGKHVYRSKSYNVEGFAIVAKDAFIAKCNAITTAHRDAVANRGFNINTDLISPMKQM